MDSRVGWNWSQAHREWEMSAAIAGCRCCYMLGACREGAEPHQELNMRACTTFVAFFLLPVAALSQETVTHLTGPGQFSKFLTPGLRDEWIFEGEKGETIIAHVATRDFDSILGLALKKDNEDKELFPEVDDPGSDSRFSFRLPQKGQYKILVHAFKYKGGGNYELNVRRFLAKPLEVGKPVVGTFDHAGKSYHYFQGAKDRILTTEVKGTSPDAWKMLNYKGREMADWAGAVRVEEDGENCLEVSGRRDMRYEILVREARRQDLGAGKTIAGRFQQGEMDVWSFSGKPGDLRLIEVERKGELAARVIHAPLEKKSEKRLAQADAWREITFLPVASRAGCLRFAVLLGCESRYELQLLAQTPASYQLKMADPSVAIGQDQEASGSLPVGGAAFYSFRASPGDLLHADLGSQKFVPLLRLYDVRGNLVDKNDANTDAPESLITHMVVQAGLYRLQVSSIGDGGGGDFRLALRQIKLKELAVGGRGQGTLQASSTDFWAFAGKEGQTVFLSVRSPVCDPVASLRSPDGVELASDDHGGADIGSLLAVKLPKTGRYTVWVSSRRGAGQYRLRLIDGD